VPRRRVVERDSPSGAQYFVASVTVGSPSALVWTPRPEPAGQWVDRVASVVIGHRREQRPSALL